MKVFRYKAKDAQGQLLEGLVEGESREGVSRNLVARGLFPISVAEVEAEDRMPHRTARICTAPRSSCNDN